MSINFYPKTNNLYPRNLENSKLKTENVKSGCRHEEIKSSLMLKH